MHCGYIAVHTDARHETNAHVDVSIEKDPRDSAGDVAKHPVIPIEVVVDPEGKRAQDDDICQGQVADVHAEGGAGVDPEGEHIDGSQVSREPKDQGKDVDGWEQVDLVLCWRGLTLSCCLVAHC